MKLINVDKLIMQLPDDLLYDSNVCKVLALIQEQEQELHFFKCPNCGNLECFTDEELKNKMLFCSQCGDELV